MRRFQVWLTVGVVAGAVAGPRTVLAQGYGVYEHGTCAMGRAGTGVASPCADGSTIFFNPAGLARMTQQQVSAGITLIKPSGGFENEITGVKTDMKEKVYPVPHLFYQRRLNDRFAAGFGVFAPYGLGTEWPETFEGRFLGYKSVVQAIYLQPTLAVKLTDRISVGGGIDVTHLHVELRQHLDLSTVALPPPAPPGATFANLGIAEGTDFADAQISGNAWNMGANFGIHWQATDQLSFGARYLTRQKIEVTEGTVEFAQLQTGIVLAAGNPFGVPAGTPLDAVLAPRFLEDSLLSAQGGTTSLTLPEQLVLGAAYQLTPKVKLLLDWQRTNWKVFDVLVLNFERAGTRTIVENYQETDGFRLGGEYAWSPTTTFRAGFLTHDAAAPSQTVTPNLPEGKRSRSHPRLWHQDHQLAPDGSRVSVHRSGGPARPDRRRWHAGADHGGQQRLVHLQRTPLRRDLRAGLLTGRPESMKSRFFAASLALILPVLAACHEDESLNPPEAPPVPSGGPLFQTYVAMGNSITAGVQSAGINDSTQTRSYAVLLAEAMGATFNYPRLNMPGCPPPFLNNVTQERVNLPGLPAPTSTTCYLRAGNLTPNNVGVPFARGPSKPSPTWGSRIPGRTP